MQLHRGTSPLCRGVDAAHWSCTRQVKSQNGSLRPLFDQIEAFIINHGATNKMEKV